MKTSDAGVSLICAFEGFVPRAYDDFRPQHVLKPGDQVRGTLTIGYGSTGAHVHIGDTVTEAEARELLRADLGSAEQAVSAGVKVPLTQNQFDALASFAFNVGAGNLKSSTLLRKLNARDYQGAADQFPAWNKSKGKVLAGLVKRRAAERELFLSA